MAAGRASGEKYTLTAPGTAIAPLVLSGGFGAAVSRSLTAAQHPRSAEPGVFLLHGEDGRLVARVVRGRDGCTQVWASDRGIEDANLEGEPAHAHGSASEASSTRRPDPPAAIKEGGDMSTKTETRDKRKPAKSDSAPAAAPPVASAAPPVASAAKERVSTREAVREVLKKAGKPLPTSEIVSRVLATKGVELKGKTPAATIAACLSVENGKADGLVVRVDKGTYKLRDGAKAAAAK